MENISRNFLLLLVILVWGSSLNVYSQKQLMFNNGCQVAGVGAQGTVLVKALGIGKSISDAKNDARRNAVYSTLFLGFPNTEVSVSSDMRPMIEKDIAYSEYKDFFDDFFSDGGRHLDFVSFVDQFGELAPGEMIKIKKRYHVKLILSVQKEALRKELEKRGIVKPFGIY